MNDFSVEILKHPTDEDWMLAKTCTLVTVDKKKYKAAYNGMEEEVACCPA